jgi:DNA-binding transcriptional LysR family regulator
MDFRLCQLRSLVVLAETLNYARAARNLFMTQPTLSVQIKALEDSFQVKLFDRSRKGVSVTPAGKLLVATARQLLRDVDALGRDMQQMVPEATLRICCSQIARYEVLPRLMRVMASRYPSVQMEFLTMKPEERIDALLTGKVDVLIMVPAREVAGTEFYSMGKENLIAVVPDRLPFSQMSTISIRDFAQETLLTVSEREFSGGSASLLDVLAAFGLRPPRIIEGPLDHTAQMAIVAGGSAVTFASESSLGIGFPGTLRIPFQERVSGMELGIMVRREQNTSELRSLTTLLLDRPYAIPDGAS